MDQFASLWSYQENIDELKQKLLYTTLELEALKTQHDEEMKRNNEVMKQLLQSLKIASQERDEAKDQLQRLLNNIKISNDQPIFMTTNPIRQHQGPLMIPTKANSSNTGSNSLSEAYNHSSSPVDSMLDPIETLFVQDNDQNGGFSNSMNGFANAQKVDQATLIMEDMIRGKTLPKKGNLLEAVVEAGPLLQTLLLAGSLPRWRNPPSLKTFHIPPMVSAVDHDTAVQKLDVEFQNKLLKSPMVMVRQSQPYAKMGCGNSSQMMVGGGGGGGVLSFGDVNLGTIVKKQRLH